VIILYTSRQLAASWINKLNVCKCRPIRWCCHVVLPVVCLPWKYIQVQADSVLLPCLLPWAMYGPSRSCCHVVVPPRITGVIQPREQDWALRTRTGSTNLISNGTSVLFVTFLLCMLLMMLTDKQTWSTWILCCYCHFWVSTWSDPELSAELADCCQVKSVPVPMFPKLSSDGEVKPYAVVLDLILKVPTAPFFFIFIVRLMLAGDMIVTS